MANFLLSKDPRQNEIAVVPPLKWAGGKRWFASNHLELLPEKFNNYVEPFLGSGALFFSVRPEKSILSDVNEELINLYEVIRDEPKALKAKLAEHQRKHGTDYYYEVRRSRPRKALNTAARTLYLNRTCWNGLYRVNLQGQFNVPKGTKDNVVLETDNFEKLAAILLTATIKCQDFELTLDAAQKGDFAFIDPPYTVAHNNNGFVKYNQNLFSWDDQVRLRNAVKRATRRGVKVLVTNAAHESVISLYKDFEHVIVDRAGVIAGKASARGRYEEVVIKCF
ncbi:MAG: Dam family site-specific DNA-(adenine-N6)-methyltransferase [Hylemonella sp.]|nr:Dam family site-specific DNA-(adenine-N6)-methyltransferase [Hylemonella sp.]